MANGPPNPFNLPEKVVEKPPAIKPADADNSPRLISELPTDTQAALTEDQKQIIGKYMGDMRYGISGIAPIICKGDQCPFYNKCPLVKAGIELPIGKDCPVEASLQKMWTEQFIQASGIDLNAGDVSAYDLLLLNDLSNFQLLEARATMELSENPQIQLKTVVAFDKDGQPVFSYTLNSLIQFKEKISKMKMKILREMIATRKVQSEDDNRRSNDRSVIMADKLRQLKERLGKDAINIVDADFTVKEEKKDE